VGVPPLRSRALSPAFLPAVAILVITLPFVVPLLRPGWLQTHEGLSNPIRLSQLLVCWRDGMWSGRWFPDLYFGQGYPFLGFYAPLVFHVAGVCALAGASIALALKVPVALGTIAGAAGTYRLARSGTGPAGALAAAALYTYAPYCLRDIFIRGDLSEYVALGVLPWALWSVLQLRRPTRWSVPVVVVAGALAILSHNIVGLLTGLAMAATAVVAFISAEDRRRTAISAFLGGVGALLVTAFFWMPALYETRFVQISLLTTGHFDLSRHYVTPAQLLAPGSFPKPHSQALPMTPEIGYPLVAGLVLFAGFGWRAVRRSPAKPFLAVAAGLLIVGLVLVTRAGDPIYRAMPLLQFVQFPWRLLSLVALGGALQGGFGLDAATAALDRRWRVAACILFVIGAILPATPLLGPKPNFRLSERMLDRKTLQRQPGTTTVGEYLPLAATERTAPRWFDDDGVRLMGKGDVVAADRRTGRYDLTIEAEEPMAVHLRDLYYPGWTVLVDGGKVAPGAAEGQGSLRFPLAAGRHEVRARLEPTPVRRSAGLVSIVSIVVLLAGTAWRRFAAR